MYEQDHKEDLRTGPLVRYVCMNRATSRVCKNRTTSRGCKNRTTSKVRMYEQDH